MNRILFDRKQDSYELDPRDPRFEHVRGVLRMGVGDRFDVGVVNGPVGKATIRELEDARMQVAVEWGEVPPPPPAIHLLVGLCRPATVRKLLFSVPTLGAESLSFVPCGRSDPAYGRSGIWKDGGWRKYLVEGAEQAFDTHIPETRLCGSLQEAMDAIPEGACRLMLDVYGGTERLSAVKVDPAQPVCLAVGPERGWNANDRRAFLGAGFQLVSLNERVLRVETAVTVGLTLVLAKLGAY